MGAEQPIRLARIEVENLGPLGNRGFELGSLNVFYGHNETGKTYLVEFLMRSLFSHAREWTLREGVGQGKVWVEGLEDEPLSFTPGGRGKLEDRWEEEGTGLPTNMARLLVVKGGELAFGRGLEGGINRQVLKKVLSSEGLIDDILDGIQKTLRNAKIEDGEIIGDSRGKIGDREDKLAELERLDRVLEEVRQRVSGGELRRLQIRRKELERELGELNEAKRYHAHELHEDLSRLRKERAGIPDEELSELGSKLGVWESLGTRPTRLEKDLRAARQSAQYFDWLDNAVRTWEGRQLSDARPVHWLWWVGAGIGLGLSFLLGLIAALTQSGQMVRLLLAAGSGVLFMAGMTLGGIYIYKNRTRPQVAGDLADRAEIKKDFEARFDRPMRGVPGLKAELERVREAKAQFTQIDEQLKGAEREREGLLEEIRGLLAQLGQAGVDEEQWEYVAAELGPRARELDQEIGDLQSQLDRLGVDPSDMVSEAPEKEYSADALEKAQNELEGVK